MNTDITDSAINTMCYRINDQAKFYLPKLYKKFEEQKKHQDELQIQILKIMGTQAKTDVNMLETEVKQQKFMFSSLKVEMDLLNAKCSDRKMN